MPANRSWSGVVWVFSSLAVSGSGARPVIDSDTHKWMTGRNPPDQTGNKTTGQVRGHCLCRSMVNRQLSANEKVLYGAVNIPYSHTPSPRWMSSISDIWCWGLSVSVIKFHCGWSIWDARSFGIRTYYALGVKGRHSSLHRNSDGFGRTSTVASRVHVHVHCFHTPSYTVVRDSTVCLFWKSRPISKLKQAYFRTLRICQ